MFNFEPIIFAYRGRFELLTLGLAACFDAPVREHSRKPDFFYDLVKAVSPEPRLDIFGRESRDGFEVWGNEPDKFTKEDYETILTNK